MANTQALCSSFKKELLTGDHRLYASTLSAARAATTTPVADSLKAALYLASATINATTGVYTVTGEVTGTGYTAGGVAVTAATAPAVAQSVITGDTAYWTPSASIVYSGVTLSTSFDCLLIYNSTQGNKAISVHTFTAQTITAGTLTLTMPTNNATTGLIRLA